jgi:hypothetical protein
MYLFITMVPGVAKVQRSARRLPSHESVHFFDQVVWKYGLVKVIRPLRPQADAFFDALGC